MTADDITISRLADLRAILDASADTVARLEHDAEFGKIDPAEAADILNETLSAIKSAFR